MQIENPPQQLPIPEGRLVLGVYLAKPSTATDTGRPGANSPAFRFTVLADMGGRAETARKTILSLTTVTKYFDSLCAVNAVDLVVERGTIHAVIGPNGSGKTTLLNVISGLLPADGGQVVFLDADITHLPAYDRNRMGLGRTFQRAKLMPLMTCADNVMAAMHQFQGSGYTFGTYLRLPFSKSKPEREMRKKAWELLDLVGLAGFEERWAEDLVWVNSQRLQIARALAGDPQLLLLDEPTAGMGVEESDEIDVLIRRLKSEGITVILVAHDMRLVMGICDRITVLNFGEKIAEGRAEEVQTNPLVLEAYLGAE